MKKFLQETEHKIGPFSVYMDDEHRCYIYVSDVEACFLSDSDIQEIYSIAHDSDRLCTGTWYHLKASYAPR